MSYCGVIVGCYVNWIGYGLFVLNGIEYILDKNGGEYNLYGGLVGFYKKVWVVSV